MSERLCGPKELAEQILDYRKQNAKLLKQFGGPPLVDSVIEELVQLVYHASLLPEEGRYPRFRVLFTYQPFRPFGHRIQLGEDWLGHPIKSPESIRRLAPAIGGREPALLVGWEPVNGLAAWGIVDFEQFCVDPWADPMRLSEMFIPPNGMLFLRINGPGDIRAMLHPSPVFHLRGGKIRTLKSLDVVKPFGDLVFNLCSDLYNGLKSEKRIAAFVPSPQEFADEFAPLWAAALSSAIEGRHGGAFAIMNSPDCSHVKVKYKAEGGLFRAFRETLQLCLDSTDSSGPRCVPIFKLFWQLLKNHLRRVARCIGQLAATDGCVVLDRELNIKGFGGKIEWPNDPTFLPLIDFQNGQLVTNEEIENRMGTRHKSACRLAQVSPDTIVFVISQDGDLTVFYSDESRAYRVTDLEPWSSVSELL